VFRARAVRKPFILFSLTVWGNGCYSPRHTGREIPLTRSNDSDVDLLQGTLDLLVLKAVSLGPLHGYGVLLRIQQISGDRLEIRQASLYPALYRIEHEGWIAGEWGESENKRRARYYKLTAAGRRRLDAETNKWNQFADLVGSILKVKPEEL
jgi:PadR family transcriptional regulator, regulatory protein PadR